MVEFLLYEPDKGNAEKLRNIAKSLFVRMKCPYKMSTYFTYEDTIKVIQHDVFKYDIVLIDMEDENAARKVARSVRKHNYKAILIFIGDDIDKLHRLLIFQPSALLPNELEQKHTERIIYALYMEQRRKNRYFIVKNRCEIERIPYEHIDYFESSNRKIYLHLNKSTRIYEFNEKLDEVMQSLSSPNFIRCHQSFLVNMENIKIFNKAEKRFITFTGKQIDISKRSMAEVTAIFEHYIGVNKH